MDRAAGSAQDSRPSPSSSPSPSRSPSPSLSPSPIFPPPGSSGTEAWIPPPPRQNTIHLTPYGSSSSVPTRNHHPYGQASSSSSWQNHDPRSSSQQSILPVQEDNETRRKLLLVYVHGFMGNDLSFQSFPAHVHNLLTIALVETHVVHSKIYPRYKSRKAIDFARDDFSKWLEPHESPTTDVVLLGHSLGGILIAEVALLPPVSPMSPNHFRHRIIGTINFDTPFLGMHPGVISSGISSLFRSNDKPESNVPGGDPSQESLGATSVASSSVDLGLPAHDPNYNPAFNNDVRIVQRSGWNNALHFITKHSDGITRAAKQYVTSHLEFGACLADFQGLKRRYAAIRCLEDVDPYRHEKDEHGRELRRVRFVNYYTASTGREKKKKPKEESAMSQENGLAELSTQDLSIKDTQSPRSPARSPRITVQDLSANTPQSDIHPIDRLSVADRPDYDQDLEENAEQPPPYTLEDVGNLPAEELAHGQHEAVVGLQGSPSAQCSDEGLPPIPPPPQAPAAFDATKYLDPETLKIAKKAYAREEKAHKRACKDREKLIRDREKIIQKREKEANKAKSKQAVTINPETPAASSNAEAIENTPTQQDPIIPPARSSMSLAKSPIDESSKVAAKDTQKPGKTPKDRVFCVLPPKEPHKFPSMPDGRDPTWLRVYMPGVDEVGAHCGLFFTDSAAYDRLVGDVVARVEEWVGEEGTRRMVLDETS